MATEQQKCTVEGCKRTYRAKGYCNVHFHKWRKGEMPKKPRGKLAKPIETPAAAPAPVKAEAAPVAEAPKAEAPKAEAPAKE